MKRPLLGILILSVLLLGGILIRQTLDGVHAPIIADLHQASAAALAEDWASARDLLEHASIRWNHFRRITAAFTDHTPMDEVDNLFRKLQIYSRTQALPHFAALCAHAEECIRTILESHRLSWWNLL